MVDTRFPKKKKENRKQSKLEKQNLQTGSCKKYIVYTI